VDHVHAIRLANAVVDQVRRRTRQATLGHRGGKRDPLYRIRKLLLTRRLRRRRPRGGAVGEELFFSHVHLHGGPAPVRRFLPQLIDLIWNRRIDPGKVFDLTLRLEQAAEGYKAMDDKSRSVTGFTTGGGRWDSPEAGVAIKVARVTAHKQKPYGRWCSAATTATQPADPVPPTPYVSGIAAITQRIPGNTRLSITRLYQHRPHPTPRTPRHAPTRQLRRSQQVGEPGLQLLPRLGRGGEAVERGAGAVGPAHLYRQGVVLSETGQLGRRVGALAPEAYPATRRPAPRGGPAWPHTAVPA
jgi:hypothetical protein